MRHVRSPLLPVLLLLVTIALALPTIVRGQSPPALPDPTTALLTPADLPAGWTEGECECGGMVRALEDELNVETMMETCLGEFDLSAPISRSSAGAEFAGGPRGPVLRQEITLYTLEEAERLMAGTRTWLLGRLPCSWEQTSPSGEIQGWRLEELPLPQVGDDSFAIRLSMDSWSQGVEQSVVFLRRGIAISFIEITGWLDADLRPSEALAEMVARRADERLIQLLDTP